MREVSRVCLVSPDYQGVLVVQASPEARDCPEGLAEMDFLVDLDTLDRKVSVGTLAPPACPEKSIRHSTWRKETPETQEATDFPASPDPEATKVCRGCLVGRVCLDFLVMRSRVKGSRVSLGSPGCLELLATLDRRERLESWDSLECPEQGVMTVPLVSLATPENLVDQELRVYLETPSVILEVQVLKVSQEIQASQAAVLSTAVPVTMACQEGLVSLEQRVFLVKPGGLE